MIGSWASRLQVLPASQSHPYGTGRDSPSGDGRGGCHVCGPHCSRQNVVTFFVQGPPPHVAGGNVCWQQRRHGFRQLDAAGEGSRIDAVQSDWHMLADGIG